MIAELSAKFDELDKKVAHVMGQDERHILVKRLQKTAATIDEDIEKIKEDISIAEEAAKIDAGTPVIKTNGIVSSKALVIGPHNKLRIPQEIKRVSFMEGKDENNQ